nr:MAG TPA: Protein of unknown function (DUF551) [Caudoviricetes sp.]
MTNREIIQALRCGEDANGTPCPEPGEGEIVCYDPLKLAAADLIEHLTAENVALREKAPQWISVDDRHPKPGTRVLATDGVFVGEAYRTSADTWRRYDGIAMRDCIGSAVTHWMPLPETPEEGEKA